MISKDPQTNALDALMASDASEGEGTELSTEKPPMQKEPKGDPAALVKSIQADLDRLSSLLS